MNDNIIIAEFMGWTEDMDSITHEGDKWWSSPDTHKYHTSWDWLMPVVQTIEAECEGVPQELIDLSLYSNFGEVYWAVVEFIKKHNI